jgi:hypothetical protein
MNRSPSTGFKPDGEPRSGEPSGFRDIGHLSFAVRYLLFEASAIVRRNDKWQITTVRLEVE